MKKPEKMGRKTVVTLICMALNFTIMAYGCGGGGGNPPAATKENVTLTGKVEISEQYSPLQNAQCLFVDLQGAERGTATANDVGQYTLNVPVDVEGEIHCTPPGFSNLVLSTYCSTKGLAAGDTLDNEDVTIVSTLVAQVLESEDAADPGDRKSELMEIISSGQDPDFGLMVELSTKLYLAILHNNLDIDFSGRFSRKANSDGAVSGKVCTGVAQAPIAGAQCTFVMDGDLGADRRGMQDAVLADLGDNGRLSRIDLKVIQDQINSAYRWREQEIMAAFARVFPNGIGQAYTTTADANGAYVLAVPPETPGYVCCVPPDQDQLVLSAYVPGRMQGETLTGQDVTPATTVHTVQIASQLRSTAVDIQSTKEHYLQDIAGLDVQMLQDNAGVSGFELGSGPAPANKAVGLAAFSATALFNVLYHNALNVDFPAVLADFFQQQGVDPAFLTDQGLDADDARACSEVVGAAVARAESSLDVQLSEALSTARINVTVLEIPDGPAVSEVKILGNRPNGASLNCSGCDTLTDAQGRVSLIFSDLADSAMDINLMEENTYLSKTSVQVIPLSTQDITIVLHQEYYLEIDGADYEVRSSGYDGFGKVVSDNGEIDCSFSEGMAMQWEVGCFPALPPGTQITLTAVSSEGSTFAGWGEGTVCSGTEPTCTLTMDRDHTVIPLFSPQCEQIREDGLYDISPKHLTSFADGRDKLYHEDIILDDFPGSCGALSINSDSDWVTVFEAYGYGDFEVGVSVNPDPGPRTATFLLGAYPVTIAQDGQQCAIEDYGVAPVTTRFDAAGGTSAIEVRASANCPWQAETDKNWITLTTGGDGSSGDGTVTYSVSENIGASRWGYITIAGTFHLVVQNDAAATPLPALTIQGEGNGSGLVIDDLSNIYCNIDGAYVSGQCNMIYKPDAGVELYIGGATVDPNYSESNSVFTNWNGSCGGGLPRCRLTMDQMHTAIARFMVSNQAELGIGLFEISNTYVPIGKFIPVTYNPDWTGGFDCQVFFWTENRGIEDAQNFSIGFYISSDAKITTDDFLLANGRVNINGLEAKNRAAFTITEMWLPTDLPPGPAYFGVLIDEFNAVDEAVETNNSYSVPVYLVPPESDISVSRNMTRAAE